MYAALIQEVEESQHPILRHLRFQYPYAAGAHDKPGDTRHNSTFAEPRSRKKESNIHTCNATHPHRFPGRVATFEKSLDRRCRCKDAPFFSESLIKVPTLPRSAQASLIRTVIVFS